MRAVIDSSTLISLAWSGQLPLIARLRLTPVVIESVFEETVTAGLAAGHADAVAIEAALLDAERLEDPPGRTADEKVVLAGRDVGVVVTNDVVVGRRAANAGGRWLRTADLVVLAHATGELDVRACRAAIVALHDAGRLTGQLRDAYLEELS